MTGWWGFCKSGCRYYYQLAALGLVLNMIVAWNTRHMGAIVDELKIELIADRVWKSTAQAELATAE